MPASSQLSDLDFKPSAMHSSDCDHVEKNESFQDALQRVRTAGSVSIPPALFEQLYLSPENKVKGELRKTFGNPTPIALGGFLLCTTPLSMILLGWQGATGLGTANIGTYFYLGGMLLTLGGVGEWILGNTFPATVFLCFGGFWFTFGATLQPFYGAYAAYSSNPVADPYDGLTKPAFMSSFSFFLVAMVLLCLGFTVAALRTNIVFFLLFATILPCFSCLAASFWAQTHGNTSNALTLQHVGAALLLVLTLLGWYIWYALLLLSVDFPIRLPLGDLSTIIKGASDREKSKSARSQA